MEFPNFKKLELQDKEMVESITKLYPSYSDFNFISLYSWNTDLNTSFTLLNGNLVIQMKDYSSDNKIFSFLGNKSRKETIDALLNYAEQEGTSLLNMLPEVSLGNNIDLSKYEIQESRDQFDYIWAIEELATMRNSNLKKQRNLVKNFETSYTFNLKTLNLSSEKTQSEIMQLFNRWKESKIKEGKYFDEAEEIAISNFFKFSQMSNLISLGIYIEDLLVGFEFFEAIDNQYCLFHFEKTDHQFKGISEYIKKAAANELLKRGYKYINAEQDLGIEGLRRAKLAYNPVNFLKKYTLNRK